MSQPAGDDPLKLARQFLGGLEAMDAEAVASSFADDGVQDMPFSPPGFPKQVKGADALHQLSSGC
jgi:hypothetical protein